MSVVRKELQLSLLYHKSKKFYYADRKNRNQKSDKGRHKQKIKYSFCRGIKYHPKDYQEQYHLDSVSTPSRPTMIKSSFCRDVKYHPKDRQEQYHLDSVWCYLTVYFFEVNAVKTHYDQVFSCHGVKYHSKDYPGWYDMVLVACVSFTVYF
ncbi:hypothetical protein BCR43DRAFT_518126 [Syncephalastrum racemosum]|uniref:Uncharacterized protein n=1 Tax=Syncephalastrum racemosum TaxID=13706 RepID=A0A1X2H2X1_SYNRA|nr:hypothetical protein BCR43DRAFT_518126 [Syncephalastrum racemosum]